MNLPPGTLARDLEPKPCTRKEDCVKCDATGQIFDDGAPDAVPVTCPDCKGKGFLEFEL